MSDKNLPIKLVLQKASDTQKNLGGGKVKYFGEVTSNLQGEMISKFDQILNFYNDVFTENEHIPAVGKIVVKPEAIAKSHKPSDLCRNCPIIGSEDLDEIYIKVTKKSINETIELIRNPPSQKFRANLTAVLDIKPITVEEKISKELVQLSQQGLFANVKSKIKIKYFDFDDAYDDSQIVEYITKKLNVMGLSDKYEFISYGEGIKFIKVDVSSYDDVVKIASINGVKSVDFFQEYSLPLDEFVGTDLEAFLEDEYSDSEIIIGIIDGGISTNNALLSPYIVAREEYVNEAYLNPSHATFIASTIQYGNKLNHIEMSNPKRFKFIDVVAIPNSDTNFGPTDTVGEEELMEIIEDAMNKYSARVKVWNISLGIESLICQGAMSDLGIFLDYIQDKYKVQIFVSSGNLNQNPLRTWPPQNTMGECDRIISPADSVRAITVGSLALFDSENSIVKGNEPSPFSRRGPGANYIVKPDVVDYGGNIDTTFSIAGLGMKGLGVNGEVIEGIGTSYSNPRVVQKFTSVYDEMVEKDLMLAKAMIIHSARLTSRELLEQSQDNIKYYGFGMPSVNTKDILQCSEDEITLVFRQKISQGTHLELFDFPYPNSLIRDGKCFGEIGMTLAYNPVLDQRYGREYCRTNIDVSFGTYKYAPDGKIKFAGCVPLENSWDEKFEKSRVENGFKWSPIKSYYRKISNKGIQSGDGWKIRIDMNPRNGLIVPSQEFVLIVTIKDPGGNDIYSEVVNGLRTRGYVTNNLETKQQLRQRQ
ncbi:S8 family peptidase [Paenibacillus sp. FSL K6-2524]|uniref:S8 family peptidase n=1 Tax=Paenibacillus sp. FSL K6-2524 TaxID=2954516 RepID=UPI0030F74212